MTTVELSREQIIAEIERVVRERLGEIDARSVLALYRLGLLDGSRIQDALILADLLPAGDPFLTDVPA